MKNFTIRLFAVLIIMAVVSHTPFFGTEGFAQTASKDLQPYISSVQQSGEGMTLWQMIQGGGIIMIILLFLSLGTIALIVYNFISISYDKLVPAGMAEHVIQKLTDSEFEAAKKICRKESNIISTVVEAGLEKRKRHKVLVRETMEKTFNNEIAGLWQNISYLADIATVAPLIGLLGTVLGMIQAFNVIAFQTAIVKPLLLAGGVSKAMVTTAGGLIVAIPAFMFYSYFKGKFQNIIAVAETYTDDLIRIMEKNV
ncbi:MAG: MotA/TolQ/ExbB proton channel family protein [Candidatus Omnitrophica bacterium]|nr:MotA/TolQ/ExbB proton channel family protein [Candidatus Omnitrophota bacterium]